MVEDKIQEASWEEKPKVQGLAIKGKDWDIRGSVQGLEAIQQEGNGRKASRQIFWQNYYNKKERQKFLS